jgi:hypothetical protein
MIKATKMGKDIGVKGWHIDERIIEWRMQIDVQNVWAKKGDCKLEG